MASNLTIRETRLEDVPQFDRIRRATLPWHFASVEAQRGWITSSPPESQALMLSAEIDGKVVAFARGSRNLFTKEEGVASVAVMVDPDHRHQGIGDALRSRVEAHLKEIAARRAICYAVDEAASIGWAEQRGWTQGSHARFSRAHLADLPPQPDIPAGVTVADFAEVGPEAVHALDIVGGEGEPGDVSYDGAPLDLWVKQTWEAVDLDLEASTVVLVDGVPAALTVVEVNRETGRCWSGGTCTHPRYRGRGLSKLVKSVALRKARAAGVTEAITANDYTNGPMLAVNTWLGYHEFASERSMLKTFS